MDGDLSFEDHISLKVKKANVVMGQFFVSGRINVKKALYHFCPAPP